MDAVSTLLKCLKSKRYISDIEKAKAEVSTERITLRKEDDLFIRDAITGYGTILKEDLDHHYYITMNEQTMKTAQSIAKEENYSVVNCCLSRNFIP